MQYKQYVSLESDQRGGAGTTGPLLSLSDLSDEPLHRQMFRQLRAMVLTGQLLPDESLPSIRTMALTQRVSVITVQRAYDDLERAGLIHSRRGKGFFVSALSDETRAAMAEARAREALAGALEAARAEGLDPARLRRLVEDILDETGGGS
jgi:GntR family transcriptional regulator